MLIWEVPQQGSGTAHDKRPKFSAEAAAYEQIRDRGHAICVGGGNQSVQVSRGTV